MNPGRLLLLALFTVPLLRPLTAEAQTIPLPDEWLFSKGDSAAFQAPEFDDSRWSTATCPARERCSTRSRRRPD
jgi:hypothetical protein